MRRWFSKRVLLGLGGAVLIVATFAYFLPTIADYRDVWQVVKALSWEWIAALLAVAAVNVLTFAPPWLVLLPGLRFLPALMMTQAATALSIVVPGGAAVGIASAYGMLRRWGFAPDAVGRSVTLVSLWNQLANLAYPILALFLLTMTGEETAVLATAAFVGVAILGVVVGALVLVLYSNRMAEEIGDLAARAASWVRARLRRDPVEWTGRSFERFRIDAVDVLGRRWHVLTLATLAGSLTVFLVLLVSLRALQVPSAEVSAVEVFAAWSLARILGSIPITPGGIGVVELSLTAALIGFGGNNAGVVAAVLVYRFLTMVPTLVLGPIAAAVWRLFPRRAPPLQPSSREAFAFRSRVVLDRRVGGRFWIGLMASVVGIGIAIGIVFLVIGAAIVAWGVLGALVVLGGLALGIAWVYDRRQQARYDSPELP